VPLYQATAGIGVLFLVAAGSAQHAVEQTDLQAFLRTTLHLSDGETSALNQGRAIVKTLPATTGREMTTVGGIRIRGSAPAFVAQFRTLEGFRTSQFVKQISRFSDSPQLRDLDPLIVDPEDLEALRKCRVGDCDVQLSADDIRRFNREIDWRSPSAAAEASALYKTILFEHLSEYRAGGRARLITYNDRETPVVLPVETSALLDLKPSLIDRVPAFADYLRHYPSRNLPQVEDFFYWSKEVFGFKPVIGLNHVSLFTNDRGGDVTIATTQLYASHYMDGSMAVSALLPNSDDGTDFYWLYVNRSRVGRLAGMVGTLSRPIVQRRARAGLSRSLLQTKQRLEAAR
jgi:hypothetical protein